MVALWNILRFIFIEIHFVDADSPVEAFRRIQLVEDDEEEEEKFLLNCRFITIWDGPYVPVNG